MCPYTFGPELLAIGSLVGRNPGVGAPAQLRAWSRVVPPRVAIRRSLENGVQRGRLDGLGPGLRRPDESERWGTLRVSGRHVASSNLHVAEGGVHGVVSQDRLERE